LEGYRERAYKHGCRLVFGHLCGGFIAATLNIGKNLQAFKNNRRRSSSGDSIRDKPKLPNHHSNFCGKRVVTIYRVLSA
jgi:hypothetical protein